MDLVSALHAEAGICCFVGAGGKKSTMYALADRVERSVLTASVRIPIFDEHVARVIVAEDPVPPVNAAQEWPIGVVPAQEGDDRYVGYAPAVIDRLQDSAADVILVKADGARMRRFKAPGSHEPQLPQSTDTVVPIVSAHVIGEPLDDHLVHRPDQVARVGNVAIGTEITPQLVADVLASPAGGHKGVPQSATVIPLVNMIDNDAYRDAGRKIASALLEQATVPHVVLASMQSADPLVEVVT